MTALEYFLLILSIFTIFSTLNSQSVTPARTFPKKLVRPTKNTDATQRMPPHSSPSAHIDGAATHKLKPKVHASPIILQHTKPDSKDAKIPFRESLPKNLSRNAMRKKNIQKSAEEIARVAGPLIVSSLFQDIIKGIPIGQPDEQFRRLQKRVNSNRVNAVAQQEFGPPDLKAQQAGDITLKARAQPELPHQNAAAAAAAASRHRYSTDQHRTPLSKSERPRAAKPFAPVNGAQMRPPTAPIGQFRGQQPWSQVPQGVGQAWQQAPPFQQPQQPVQAQAQARFPAQFQPQQVQPQFQGQWPPPAQTQFLQPQPQVPQGRWPGQFPAQNPQFVPSAQRLPPPPQMSRFQVGPSAARPPPPPPLAQRSRVLPAQAVQPAQQASALIPWNQRQQPPRQILPQQQFTAGQPQIRPQFQPQLAPQPQPLSQVLPQSQPQILPQVQPQPQVAFPQVAALAAAKPQFLPLQEIALKKPSLDANTKLALCCEKRQLSPNCQSMCNFDTFTQQSLVSLFLSNTCPIHEIGMAFDCASSMADHTDCCLREGLGEFNGGQCMIFCRTNQGRPDNPMQYMGCLSVFNSIKQCYREYQAEHPNIFGDFRR